MKINGEKNIRYDRIRTMQQSSFGEYEQCYWRQKGKGSGVKIRPGERTKERKGRGREMEMDGRMARDRQRECV